MAAVHPGYQTYPNHSVMEDVSDDEVDLDADEESINGDYSVEQHAFYTTDNTSKRCTTNSTPLNTAKPPSPSLDRQSARMGTLSMSRMMRKRCTVTRAAALPRSRMRISTSA